MDFDYEEPIEKRFEDLCQDLCIEGAIREEAWEKYKDVWANYSIDGDQVQWLVCSLYECCRRSLSDGLSGHIVDNSYVSLARLLSSAKMSMVHFFHRIRKWADMTDMLDDMRDRVELLERQFAVSSVIFRNFGRSFGVLFTDPDLEQNQLKPNTSDLFRFTWLLFIKSRTSFPAVTDDLVNSYHLLACCLDWVLGVVMLSRRRDLINMDQNGLPRDFVAAVTQNKTWCTPHDEPFCMLRLICEDNDVNYVECKTVKEFFFRPFIMRLIEKELIKLNVSSYGSLLAFDNFEITTQNLNNNYEEYIIGTGDFDERIYLSPNAAEEIGSINDDGQSDYVFFGFPSTLQHKMLEVCCSGFGGFTETTKRANTNAGIISRLNGGVNFNNPETRSQILNQLQIILTGRTKEPSQTLIDLLQFHCSSSIIQYINEQSEQFGFEFQNAYIGQRSANVQFDLQVKSEVGNTGRLSDGHSPTSTNNLLMSAAQQRLQLGLTLYYMTLENILADEIKKLEKRLNHSVIGGDNLLLNQVTSNSGQTKRVKPDLTNLIQQTVFHRSLFSICMEIVLVCCDSFERHFPWILDTMNLDSLNFFKVVEVVIRSLDFPRDLVKYMNQVVEHILDSYAWRSNSSLWFVLKESGRAPSIEEVLPPEKLDLACNNYANDQTESNIKPVITGDFLQTSTNSIKPRLIISSNRISEIGVNRIDARPPRLLISSGLEDESAQAAAQLLASGGSASTNVNNMIGAETPALDHAHGVVVEDHDSENIDESRNLITSTQSEEMSNLDIKHMVEEHLDENRSSDQYTDTQQQLSSNVNYFPVRHDSLAIFFRQVYLMVSHRLRDMCQRLNFSKDLMAKIWTCIEQVVVHETDLLQDRSLDQILLCCLYGVCKMVLYKPLTFVDIVQVYRTQPQSNRDIYRRVLISRVSHGRGNTEERADLSRFYNLIFLPQMNDFIRKAASVRSVLANESELVGSEMENDGRTNSRQWVPHPSLSPMPLVVNNATSMNMVASRRLGPLGSSVSGSGIVRNVLGGTVPANDLSQVRRLASNRNIFISPVKQQVNLSPKRVIFTVGRSTGKDLQDVNLMISSAERRASMANLTMGLKRPVLPSLGSNTSNSSVFTMSTGGGVGSINTPGGTSRTVTLVGPNGFTTKRIDFNI